MIRPLLVALHFPSFGTLRRVGRASISNEALFKIGEPLAYEMAVNLFFVATEVFTDLYSPTAEVVHAGFQWFGIHAVGHTASRNTRGWRLYRPSQNEVMAAVGVWGVGVLAFTLMVKVATPIDIGELRYQGWKQPGIGFGGICARHADDALRKRLSRARGRALRYFALILAPRPLAAPAK